MSRRIADMDPRDYQTRIQIRTDLQAARIEQGLTQQKLGARLGYDGANVRRLERQGVDQSYTVTVMRWARALGLRLVLEPVGFPPPAPRRAAATLNDMMAMVGGDDLGDEWQVARIVSQLAGIRTACGVTAARMGDRLGISPTAVALFETSGASSALVGLQRHARGIAACSWRASGGYLAVRLEKAPTTAEPV